MLSTSCRAVPSTCLRCQLRSVIFKRTRDPPEPCHFPTTQCHRRGLHAEGRRYLEAEAVGEDDGIQSTRANSSDAVSSTDADEGGGEDEGDSRSSAAQRMIRYTNNPPPSVLEDLRHTTDTDGLRGHRYRSLSAHPLGRVVGKPGRRQRETSTTLQSRAMGRPFEVTIMHDIMEKLNDWEEGRERDEDTPAERPVTDTSTKHVVAVDDAPSQKDVNDSIEALRPNSTVLEEHELVTLANELGGRYKTKQLSKYLTAKLRLDKIDGDSIQINLQPLDKRDTNIKRSFWQAGRSPITERLSTRHVVRKGASRKSKTAVVQQILRLGWNLHSSTELQSLGELELHLSDWQFAYLFAPTGPSGQPLHETLITIPLLRKTAEIRPYEPDNIVRIVARKGDAAEIADQLARGLREAICLNTDLVKFKTLFAPNTFPAQLESIFSSARCQDVGRRTSTLVQLDKTRLTIHGRTTEDVHLARRASLLLLNLPSPNAFQTYELILPGPQSKQTLAKIPHRMFSPEYATSELDLRQRSLTLGRTVLPREAIDQPSSNTRPLSSTCSNDATPPSLPRLRDAAHLTKHLSTLPFQLPFKGRPSYRSTKFWIHTFPLEPAPWRLEVGKRLHEQSSEGSRSFEAKKTPTSQPEVSALQTFIPDQVRLLSYFTPRGASEDRGLTKKVMRAHLLPSPYGKYGMDAVRRLPRIQVLYDSGTLHLHQIEVPTQIRAHLSSQQVRVCLPGEAVDLCFVRDLSFTGLAARLDDMGLGDFNTAARQALMEGRRLEYCQVVSLQLPAWLVDPKRDAQTPDTSAEHLVVPYLFNGFDTIQSANFVPRPDDQLEQSKGPPVKPLLRASAQDIFLRYSEIDGSPIGERRSETSVRCNFIGKSTDAAATDPKASTLEMTRRIVDAGVDIARAFTKFGTRELSGLWECDGSRPGNDKDGSGVDKSRSPPDKSGREGPKRRGNEKEGSGVDKSRSPPERRARAGPKRTPRNTRGTSARNIKAKRSVARRSGR